jgi:hypothetical protein
MSEVRCINLHDLIKKLEQYPREQKVVKGFHKPHCHIWDNELAFEVCENTTVGAMLYGAKEALNNTYYSFKGDKIKMTADTICSLAEHKYGCGEGIGETLLGYMLGDYN